MCDIPLYPYPDSLRHAGWMWRARAGAIIARETGYESGYRFCLPPYGTTYRKALRIS